MIPGFTKERGDCGDESVTCHASQPGISCGLQATPPSTTSHLLRLHYHYTQDAGTSLCLCPTLNSFLSLIPQYSRSNCPLKLSARPTSLYLTTVPQAYNSIFNDDSSPPTSTNIGNFPLLPLRTRVRGPAYTLPLDASLPANLSPEPDSESYDALDEVLSLFRANTFFRNFEIQGPADRLLIYGILWVSECLGKIRPNMSGR